MNTAYANDLIDALEQLKLQRQRQQQVPQVWYSRADLCRYFGISYSTLKRWETHSDFPTKELKDWCTGRYDIRKVEKFLQKVKIS
ncbi:hypothetical protein SOPP22_01695 [Shewanella sp. OPT22]|nr:hypothetical protein SOPP22_01695 [Shewanella sp. OPT22]